MAIDLDEQDGQTPLDPDERAGLIPGHLATKGDLNDWEQLQHAFTATWSGSTPSPMAMAGIHA